MWADLFFTATHIMLEAPFQTRFDGKRDNISKQCYQFIYFLILIIKVGNTAKKTKVLHGAMYVLAIHNSNTLDSFRFSRTPFFLHLANLV